MNNNDECVKLANAQAHNYTGDEEQRYTNLVAEEHMKVAAMSLHAIASGSRITKSKEFS